MNGMKRIIWILVGTMLIVSCAAEPNGERVGTTSISLDGIRAHLKFLTDDLLDGRGTGSHGLQLAENYVSAQFESHGIQPGGDNGTYFQKVPMVGYTAAQVTFEFRKGSRMKKLTYLDDFVANTARAESHVVLNNEIVYVGYGVDAPEQNWDDYKDVDVTDKILLMTVNDPSSDDSELFGGNALTYYGRWTYKNEIAGEKGAAGVILIHKTEKAGYPWQVVRNSWSGEQSMLQPKEGDPPKTALESWISSDAAEELFSMAGFSLDEMIEQAGSRDFQPVSLGINLNVDLKSAIRHFDSRNVIGVVTGQIPDEYVLYSSHLDHLGAGAPVNGDGIFNGAQDNGTGSSGLIEIAKAFAALPKPPVRSILFCAVTAEEQGLLGSKYYAQNPVYPLSKTLANVNIDAFHFLGRVKNVVFLGSDRSSLGPLGEAVAQENGLIVSPDPSPEQGHFFRSDQLSFVRAGLPAIYINPGLDIENRPEGWGMEQQQLYQQLHYHQPSDEYHDKLNLDGVVQISRLAFQIGYRIAALQEWPVWNEGDQFKSIREESLQRQ